LGPRIGDRALSSSRKPPDFQGVLYIAGAGYEHLSPTIAYRFVEVIELP
jgi:hypothetical protein